MPTHTNGSLLALLPQYGKGQVQGPSTTESGSFLALVRREMSIGDRKQR